MILVVNDEPNAVVYGRHGRKAAGSLGGRVWTALRWQGVIERSQLLVGAAIHPTFRCGLSCAAGHNAIRAAQVPIESSHSRCTAPVGSPDPAYQPALCISSCPPFPTSSTIARLVSFYAVIGSL